jgi:hypothetical protein
MNSITDISQDLRQHHALCQDLLAVVEREGIALRGPNLAAAAKEFYQTRKSLFPHLSEGVERLKQHRAVWQQLPPSERALHTEVTSLLRVVQDVIMKILMLDRENEQMFLRKGLVPPTHLPSLNRHRPHFVANLYRQSGSQ